MKIIHLALLLIAALFMSGVAQGKDLSKYPCNVFSYDICFRLPVGTQVSLSIPLDFQVYVVSKGKTVIATIYVGNAPRITQNKTWSKEAITTRGTIKVYNGDTPDAGVEVLIQQHSKEASIVHISSPIPRTNDVLHELLSSFRPCTPIKAGGQKCPVYAGWNEVIEQALSAKPER